MSNERIDLTQFRIMTGTPPDEVDLMARHNFSLEQAEVLVQLPDLIAELKRCYALIDRANESMKATRERVLSNTENWDDALFQEVIDFTASSINSLGSFFSIFSLL